MPEFDNVYRTPFYQKIRSEYDSIFNEKYFTEESKTLLTKGYSLTVRYFEKETQMPDSEITRVYSCSHSVLYNGSEEVFSFDCIDGAYLEESAAVFTVKGEDYFFFKEDLYGYSVLRFSDMSAMHYMPEGVMPHLPDYLGESFIITDFTFFEEFSFALCGGCFWACPYDVFICDLSEPLTEHRNMPLVRDIIAPIGGFEADDVCCDDIDFKGFIDGKFVFAAEVERDERSATEEYSFTGEYLREQLEALKNASQKTE